MNEVIVIPMMVGENGELETMNQPTLTTDQRVSLIHEALRIAYGGISQVPTAAFGDAVAGHVNNSNLAIGDCEEVLYRIISGIDEQFETQDFTDDHYSEAFNHMEETLRRYGKLQRHRFADPSPVCSRKERGFKFERSLAMDIDRGRV
jgi:hypothetical protein